MENFAEANIGREEDIIRQAQELKQKYENQENDNDSDKDEMFEDDQPEPTVDSNPKETTTASDHVGEQVLATATATTATDDQEIQASSVPIPEDPQIVEQMNQQERIVEDQLNQSPSTKKKPLARQSIDFDLADIAIPEKDELLFQDDKVQLQEFEDFMLINGEKLHKPFVEKPVNAEDHEIKIYYSSLNPCGSGYNVLFRKTNNLSG